MSGDGMARPMAVAYLTGEYPKVSHTFIQREIEAVRRLGWHVETFSIRSPPEIERQGPEERAAAAATTYILRSARNPLRLLAAHAALLARTPRRYLGALALAWRTAAPGLRALVYQGFYFAEAGLLAAMLRRRGLGHLHNHFADSSCTVAMLAAALSGGRFSFTMHGPSEFFAVDRWRLDEKIRRAAFVACISHFCRSQMMMLADPADWGKLPIVHCGIEPTRYGPRPGRPVGGASLTFVGRLAAAKGVPVLLDAFRLILEREPGARLTLVGDGPLRAALKARAAALGLSDAVRFTGYLAQDAVAAELAATDIFVLPSFAEGVPIVLMEAMASGVPVVTTRIAGIPELVEDGVSGFLVAPGDPAALADRLLALLADPAMRARFGAAGRARVEAAFTIGQSAAALVRLMADPQG